MAFASMFLVWFFITIIFIAISTFASIILFIISGILKKKQSVEGAVKTKAPKVTKILAWVCMMPLIGSIVFLCAAFVSGRIYDKESLPHNILSYNYEQSEKILKSGVTPDCNTYGNNEATYSDRTLLYTLCTKPEDEETEKRLQMAELLLEYGADIEYRPFYHGENDDRHFPSGDEYDIYETTDHCGETALLCAVRSGNLESVKFLVEHGADVNACDYCGFNALNIAADYLEDEEGLEIVKYLIEHGADAKNITNFGQSAVWLAERQRSGTDPYENDEILALLESESGISRTIVPSKIAIATPDEP